MNMLIHVILISMVFFGLNGTPIREDGSISSGRPDENADLFEGDMSFPPASKFQSRGVLLRGNTVAWPKGIVPYEIAPGYSNETQEFLIAAMAKMASILAVNNVQCVQFRPRVATDQYYIILINGVGCSSYVGQNAGYVMNRTVVLQDPDCISEGHVYHELLHTLGFLHEQSRPDRDSYVLVNYANIESGMAGNFEKYNSTSVDTQNTPYDYASVMHYDEYAFSSNGLPTIVPLQANVQIGQRYNMSTLDIYKVRLYYNCSTSGTTFSPSSTTTKKTITSSVKKTSQTTTEDTSGFEWNSAASNLLSYSLIIFLVLFQIFLMM